MRLHSIARKLIIPESVEELQVVVKDLNRNEIPFHIVSAGSNIVFSERVDTTLVYLMKLDESLSICNSGEVLCGCSVRIQTLVRELMKSGLGGLEFLYTLPTSIGGAVYMNAGRGRKHNRSISEYLIKVEYLDIQSGEVKILYPTKESFSYRDSIFQKNRDIVLKAYFKFQSQDPELTKELIKERLSHSNNNLEPSKPSCGSVFNVANPIIMRLFRGMRCGGAMFSSKTPNWISNVDNASAKDIQVLINRVKYIHKLLYLPCNQEIRFLK